MFLYPTCLGYIAKSLTTLVAHFLPVAGSHDILWEQLGAHAHTCGTSLDPCREVFLVGRHATRHHDERPWHWSLQSLYELRAEYIAGEHLAKVAAHFLGHAHLCHRTASRRVRHKAAVAHLCHIRIEQRTDNKASPKLYVQTCRRGIDNAAHTHCQVGTLHGCKLHHLGKHLMGKVATVGKLKCTHSTVVTSLDNALGCLDIFIIEHRHHSGGNNLREYLLFVESCHNQIQY